jgi:hypothetical protein
LHDALRRQAAERAGGRVLQVDEIGTGLRGAGSGPMMKMLVSVRDIDEALAAAQAGADFIDLKDPAAGALGGLAPRCGAL